MNADSKEIAEFDDANSKLHSRAMKSEDYLNNQDKKTNLSLSEGETLSENSFFNASFFAPSEEFQNY